MFSNTAGASDPCATGCEIEIVDEEGTKGTFTCEDCDEPVLIKLLKLKEGDKAAFKVDVGDNKDKVFKFKVKMASKELSTPPGKAEVLADDTKLPMCSPTDTMDCVEKIKKVEGALTEYTLKYDEDPNFRFR